MCLSRTFPTAYTHTTLILQMIRRIDPTSIKGLAAAQVIIDLSSAVKELLDNALDADASQINISFGTFGLEWFEVQDNGDGIDPNDMIKVGKRGYTSKITHDDDITTSAHRGFRGEALHSIISLAHKTLITSKNRIIDDAPSVGRRLTIVHGEDMTMPQIESVPCPIGTIVRVTGLLNSLPVRLAEWKRNPKRYFHKALFLLQSMALAVPKVKLRVVHDNVAVFSTSGSGDVVKTLAEAFGGLDSKTTLNLILVDGNGLFTCRLFYSIGGRKATDRQFIFVNGRPCDMPKLLKKLNDAGKSHGWTNFGIFVIYVDSQEMIDYNLTPDKRRMILVFEENLINRISTAFNEQLSKETVLTTPIPSTINTVQTSLQSSLDQPPSSELIPTDNYNQKAKKTLPSETAENENRDHTNICPSSAADVLDTISSCLGDSIEADKHFFLDKSAFSRMEVIGQFNRGFVLTRLIEDDTIKIFTIDQHASDERYRLEQLQRSLSWSLQTLLVPIDLSTLALDDRLFIESHVELFRRYGFEIVNEPSLQLISCPSLLGLHLTLKDFEEAMHLMRVGEFQGLSCLSRVAEVLGYRACRTAIMIGDALQPVQMTQVVHNLQGLEKPWICAHGRPTIRLLYSMPRCKIKKKDYCLLGES